MDKKKVADKTLDVLFEVVCYLGNFSKQDNDIKNVIRTSYAVMDIHKYLNNISPMSHDHDKRKKIISRIKEISQRNS